MVIRRLNDPKYKELQLQNTQVEISSELIALYERHCREWWSFVPLNWPGFLRKAA